MINMDSSDVFEVARQTVCDELQGFTGYTGPENPYEMTTEQIIIQLARLFNHIDRAGDDPVELRTRCTELHTVLTDSIFRHI